MECEAFSEECGRCWLHPGKRIIGVCSLCLNDHLGRLSRHPRQFTQHSSDFSSEEAAASKLEGSMMSSNMDRASGDGLGALTSSQLMMNRSRSVSDRKTLSYGFCSEETLATSSNASAVKATIEKLFTACHKGSEFQSVPAKHKAAAAPPVESKKLHQTHFLVGNITRASKRKSLKGLFFTAKEDQAAYALTDIQDINESLGVFDIKDEKELSADRDPREMDSISSSVQTDFQHKNHPWYSLFFKGGKTKEAWRTQGPHGGPHSTSSGNKDLNLYVNSSVSNLDVEPSIGLSRCKSVRASSWRLEPSTEASKGLPRSRSVSCGGTRDPGVRGARDGDRDVPSMKQVSPLMPHTVGLDEALDASTAISSNSLEEDKNCSSSLVALDLSGSKNCKTPLVARWQARSASPVLKSRSNVKHFHNQTHSLLDGLHLGKPTKASKPSSCKQRKLQVPPLFYSKDYSIINFSVSPRFSKKKIPVI